MPACSAYGCTNKPDKKISGISFHRFPKNVDLRKAWIVACRRKDWQPSSVSCLCSIHFTEYQIDRGNPKLPRLKRNAVPNVFSGFPSHLQTVMTCAAYGCKNRSSHNIPGLTFHSFPKDQLRKKIWIKSVRRANWTPSKNSKLCSAHFPEEMIDRTSLSCVRLRKNAFPVVFDAFPASLHEKTTKGTMKKNLRKPISLPITSNRHVDSENHEKEVNAIFAPKTVAMDSIASGLERKGQDKFSLAVEGTMKKNLEKPVSLPVNNNKHVDSENHEKEVNAIFTPKTIAMDSIASGLERKGQDKFSLAAKGTMKKNLEKPVSLLIKNNEYVDSETHENEMNAISAASAVETEIISSDLELESSENASFKKFEKVCAENKLLKLRLNAVLEENKKHLEKITLLEQAVILQRFEVETLNNKLTELKKS